jgi:RNA polymerase-binding transcription factor DksA
MKTKPHPTKRTPRSGSRKTRHPRDETRQVPRKWRWHHRVLRKLRDLLIDERAAGLAEAAEPIEPHSMDPADSATDEFNHELAVSLLSGEQDAIYEVDAALKRIAAGTYGICEKTGKRIPIQRLRAVPWTRFTKDAEEKIEKEGGTHRIGLAKVASVQGPGPGGLAAAEEPEKEELHARVVGRHQLAESLKTLEEGEKLEPEPEGQSPTGTGGGDGGLKPKPSRLASKQARPRKSRRTRRKSS